MTPQTVNAYYNPLLNEIVFPAAILQPPFFDPERRRRGQLRRDRRGHRPRDQPRLRRPGQPVRRRRQPRDWWTEDDHEQVRGQDRGSWSRSTTAIEPAARQPRQRRADARREHRRPRGLEIAYKAYQLLARRQAGAGDRRLHRRPALLHGWAQVVARARCATTALRDADQDRPALAAGCPRRSARCATCDAWYAAFGVKPGDKMYLRARAARAHLVRR